MEERISGTEDSKENMGTTIRENAKCKKILRQNIQEIQDTIKPKDAADLLGPCVCVERGLSTRVGKAWMSDKQTDTHTQESSCGI
jgi:hypothetical protein